MNIKLIDKKSEELTKHAPSFFVRNERFKQLKKTKKNLVSDPCTFHPVITNHKNNRKTYKEMVGDVLNMRKFKSELRQEEINRTNSLLCTFEPDLNTNKKYKSIKSKLNIKKPLNEYIQILREKSNDKKNTKLITEFEHDANELVECMHRFK